MSRLVVVLALVVLLSTSAEIPFGRPHFSNVAGQSRFSYKSRNDFHSDRKYFQQPMCGGIGVLDYDGDGWMDLVFSNGAKLPELKRTDASFYDALLRNKGDGTFEDVTARAGLSGAQRDYSYGVTTGDYDNDGWPDIFIASTGRNTLYHNNGNGTFTDVTDASGLGLKPTDTLSVQAAWFDYDNDGLLDLVLANYTLWTPATDRVCRRGDTPVYCSPRAYASVPQRLYHNLGGGRFEDVTDKSGFGSVSGKGMGIAIADFNDDGWLDVFIANDTERNLLFVNQGNGTFREKGLQYGVAYNESGAAVSSMGADAKDYDNDGRPDIFYNALVGQTWALFRNQRGKYFDYVSAASKVLQLSAHFSGWGGGFVDYNNDGWKDLFSANGDVDNLVADAAQHLTLFENRQGREFTDVSAEMGSEFGRKSFYRGVAFADLNNDGFPDIVVTALNEQPSVLLNSADNGAHWLTVRPVGRRSNRDAIGARFRLTTASGRVLYNHVTGSVGFLSTSDLRVHFGLATERTIASLEVRWPSGTVQVLKDITADRILRIEEPY